MMSDNRIGIRVIFVALVILLCRAARAAEVSWIAGDSPPARWSVQPGAPSETDIIHFSGPTRLYLNRSIAERALGGQPVLQIDSVSRKIRLSFVPPASSQSGSFWNPVCGLEGSFGPLEAGSWQFLCTQSGAAFSLSFDVGGPGAPLTILYVDANATGMRNGMSWADAYIDLQTALAAATEYCEIRLAKGVYRPDEGGDPDVPGVSTTFLLRNALVLKGGYAGSSGPNPNERDLVAYESILSGDLYGDDPSPAFPFDMASHFARSENSYHVVTAIGVNETAVLDGLTITGGHAFGSQVPDKLSCGGGFYNDAGSPVLRHCLITGNAAGHYGGGLYSRSASTPVLTGCVIADNWSQWWGGGLFNEGSDIRMEGCLISGNGTRYQGGGLCNHTNGEMILSNCIVSGNLASDGTWGRGGALYSFLATTQLVHCTFTGNRATLGASLACDSVGPAEQSSLWLSHCILWDANDAVWNNDRSRLEMVYCDVWGGWPGEGNMDVDPLFVETGYWSAGGTPADPCDDSWTEGDYDLRWGSPCVDAGDPREVPDAEATDFAGRPRLSGAGLDIGAYELRNEPPTADAGPDVAGFSLTGDKGSVTLDGSGSFDPEGRPLSYFWYQDGKLASVQKQFTIELPLGEYVFTLVVNDGVHDSAPDEVLAHVTHVMGVEALITPTEMERYGTDKPILGVLGLPRGRRPGDFDATESVLLFPGGAKAVAQTAFTWLNGKTIVLVKFNRADLMAAVPENGPVELRIVGRLTDGQYFCGIGTVCVK